jgi:F0F1-type ATP synthase gamma subunit
MTCLDSMLRMLCAQVDAMSDAVDNAEVMLSCISLAYKESASKDTHLSAAVM